MSVSNTQWYNWVPPYAPQTREGASQGADFASIVGAMQNNTGTPPSANTPGMNFVDPFQRNSAEPQAGAPLPGAGLANPSGPGAQQPAAEVQPPVNTQALAPLSIGGPDAQSLGTDQTGSSQPVQPQSHHHHHQASGSAQTPAAASHQSVSQILAADTAQALQAYASSSSSATQTELTV